MTSKAAVVHVLMAPIMYTHANRFSFSRKGDELWLVKSQQTAIAMVCVVLLSIFSLGDERPLGGLDFQAEFATWGWPLFLQSVSQVPAPLYIILIQKLLHSLYSGVTVSEFFKFDQVLFGQTDEQYSAVE